MKLEPSNIFAMEITFETFHSDMSPLKSESRNNLHISQILTESLNIMKENADYYKLDKNILYRVVSNKNIF